MRTWNCTSRWRALGREGLAIAGLLAALAGLASWLAGVEAQSGTYYMTRLSTSGAVVVNNTKQSTFEWPTGANLFLDVDATGSTMSMFFLRGAEKRWEYRMDSYANGSNIRMIAYDDDENSLGSAWTCTRDSGLACTFAGAVTAANLVAAGASEITGDATNSAASTWESDGPVSASLAASTSYQFTATLIWAQSADVLPDFALTGPASPTFVQYQVQYPAEGAGGTTWLTRWCSGYDCGTELTTAGPSSIVATGTDYLATVQGTIRNGSTAGALTIRTRTSSGTLTLRARSSLVVTKIG